MDNYRRLQWSHVFSDMVRSRDRETAGGSPHASMEPCLFRHGKVRSGSTITFYIDGFNGAMSFQTW
ncbi:protein of unknown function [Methanoculleus bourgensis]|uniref:Uncharacterized protein n=1 Tax=Methanoculleus bourgensis TaxID=83986 RepID=A0A0X8XY61_9EURY|nr:protein of unknown function [Methanoculleus bourgensis]